MYLRLVAVWMMAMIAGAQTTVSPEPNPLPMPPDRAADSYEIYSLLLEQELKSTSSTPTYWLVDETTDSGGKHSLWSCTSDETSQGPQTFSPEDVKIAFNDPHNATPPKGQRFELSPVLDDFDLHCSERVALKADDFYTALPVRLYKHGERFTGFPAGAAGIASFSEVYFDTQHTRALVHQSYTCGDGCGARRGWRFLERTDGRWSPRHGFLGYADYHYWQ